MKIPLLICACLVAGAAQAKVTESVEFTAYDVDVSHARSLVRALDAASPHRVDGKVVYGMTRYRVGWHYRYRGMPGGTCQVAEVETKMEATVSMPRPLGGSDRQNAKLDPFLAGLRVHELGHVAIGREAAQAVDAALLALPPQSDCKQLEAAIDAAASQAMAAFKDRGAQYDAETGQGKTQGAWLYE